MKRILAFMAALAAILPAAPPAPAASFKDHAGRLIKVTRPAARIISLYAAHTENLFSLGLGKKIIGVSRSEDFPPAALTLPVFSPRDDAERFIAAGPDLVLVRPMISRGYPGLVAALERAGITVVSLQPKTVGGMFAYWGRLGALTGREKQARAMAARFKRELARLKAKAAQVPPALRPRVYFEAIHRKMKTFAPGAMALFCLKAAGGVNLAADAEAVRGTNIAYYGKERILSLAPRLDVYLAQVGAMNRVTVRDIMTETGFSALKAVKNHRVRLIDERLVSRPTLRLLKGIALIHKILYPAASGK